MKIQCPKCNTSYRIDDEKIPAQGGKVRCRKCQTSIFVKPVKEDAPAESAKKAGPSPSEKPPGEHISPDVRKKEEAKPSDIPSKNTDQRIYEYLEKGDQDAAAKLLFDQVKGYVEQKDFSNAEEILEKMYDLTPMALNEVVKAGEIIEEAKGKAIDHNHLSMWSGLYNLLSSTEVNEVYFSMKKESLSENEILFKQGDNNSNLYLIEEGKLRVSFYDSSTTSDTVLTDLVPGDIVNENSFISFSVTTNTVTAVEKSRLAFLEKIALLNWKDKHPGIEKKLESFCRSKEKIAGVIEKSGKEPRAHKRIRVSLPAMIQLLDDSGKPLRMPFKVMIYDISLGGMSYIVKQSQADEAGRLLGNTMVIQTAYGHGETKHTIKRKAKIVAVRLRPFDESSVHIKFTQPLEEEVMKEIGQLKKNA